MKNTNANTKTLELTIPMAKVSTTVGKLGSIPTMNLPPQYTCRPDAPCAKGCYARKNNFNYSTVKNRLQENYDCYQYSPDLYFQIIDSFLSNPTIIYRYFRWHSAGDIPNLNYLDSMCAIAKKHPLTRFLCFTKKYELCNEYFKDHERPENLTIVWSMWGIFGTDIETPHDFPKAWVRFKTVPTPIPENAFECTNKCEKCFHCWHLKTHENVVFNKH